MTETNKIPKTKLKETSYDGYIRTFFGFIYGIISADFFRAVVSTLPASDVSWFQIAWTVAFFLLILPNWASVWMATRLLASRFWCTYIFLVNPVLIYFALELLHPGSNDEYTQWNNDNVYVLFILAIIVNLWVLLEQFLLLKLDVEPSDNRTSRLTELPTTWPNCVLLIVWVGVAVVNYPDVSRKIGDSLFSWIHGALYFLSLVVIIWYLKSFASLLQKKIEEERSDQTSSKTEDVFGQRLPCGELGMSNKKWGERANKATVAMAILSFVSSAAAVLGFWLYGSEKASGITEHPFWTDFTLTYEDPSKPEVSAAWDEIQSLMVDVYGFTENNQRVKVNVRPEKDDKAVGSFFVRPKYHPFDDTFSFIGIGQYDEYLNSANGAKARTYWSLDVESSRVESRELWTGCQLEFTFTQKGAGVQIPFHSVMPVRRNRVDSEEISIFYIFKGKPVRLAILRHDGERR